MLLRHVRTGRAHSRADLVALTGASRNTVSARVDQLIAAGLLEEGGRGWSTGGRPPVLHPRPPSSRRLAAISWSTRALTVFREAPVSATRSARLRARPVRTWRSSMPAEAEVCATAP